MAADPLEFESWKAFHRLHPFDDASRFYRPAAMVANFLQEKHDTEDLLRWLEMRPDPFEGYNEAEIRVFKSRGVKPPAHPSVRAREAASRRTH